VHAQDLFSSALAQSGLLSEPQDEETPEIKKTLSPKTTKSPMILQFLSWQLLDATAKVID